MAVQQPIFERLIQPSTPTSADQTTRRWIYIPYDRFTDRTGPLTEQPANETAIVIVESVAKGLRRPYHKRKLALLISNMRHFALEQAARGVRVRYHFSTQSHGQALLALQQSGTIPALTAMEPAERELRLDLAAAQSRGLHLTFVPDTTWLSTSEDFTATFGAYAHGKSYVMDRFYRRMRQKTGILMRNARPIGGRFSFDAENRSPYRNEVPVPIPPAFAPDEITREVLAFVEATYPHHFGTLQDFDLPTTQADSDALWHFFLEHLLPHFGRFEDAMRDDHLQLFHSKTSASLNLGRLLAADLIRDVAHAADTGAAPFPACEGFIRQLLGWREFMRHLHRATDGYRALRGYVQDEPRPAPQETSPDRPERVPQPNDDAWVPVSALAGATPSALGASLPLPAAYWGLPSGLHCLDTVVSQVIAEGWSHHITRLMVLSNLATLCGFSPRELTDWFWFAYIDAYDWVVEPNVLGMATYADGGLTATKPYVSGAAYIHRMSNFCASCHYDPKKTTGPGSCPFTALYWTFLERNRSILGNNFRLQMPYKTLDRKSAQELASLRARADEAVAHLQSFTRPAY